MCYRCEWVFVRDIAQVLVYRRYGTMGEACAPVSFAVIRLAPLRFILLNTRSGRAMHLDDKNWPRLPRMEADLVALDLKSTPAGGVPYEVP
jgi:hypothetical protein